MSHDHIKHLTRITQTMAYIWLTYKILQSE